MLDKHTKRLNLLIYVNKQVLSTFRQTGASACRPESAGKSEWGFLTASLGQFAQAFSATIPMHLS
jgi:hypothetical protein